MTNEDIYPKGITQTEAKKCRSKLCYTGEKLLERTKEMVNLMKRLERMAKREQVVVNMEARKIQKITTKRAYVC
ncbi:unnamed protein product [Arctogadus glacialis]